MKKSTALLLLLILLYPFVCLGSNQTQISKEGVLYLQVKHSPNQTFFPDIFSPLLTSGEIL